MAHLPSPDHGQGRDAARAAAKLHGMAEALGVLRHRGPAERQRAAEYAAEVLAREVQPADWRRAGLPAPAPAGPAGGVAVSHEAVLHLASTALDLRCSGLPAAQRADPWIRLATLF